jgi:flagellar assembly protein FliH
MGEVMTAVPHKRFEFGTVFGDAGHIVSQPKREKKHYTPEEVEAIRAAAYAEGEASAAARAQMAQAAAVQQLADAAAAGLNGLTQAVHAHKEQAVRLALACAQKIAAEALEQFPHAALQAALDALAQEIQPAARLLLNAREPDDALKAAAEDAAMMAGFSGQIQFRDHPALPKGAFEIVWPDGRADYNPSLVFEALERTLSEALEAEAYHDARAKGAA